jgi:hypothetical protein
MTSNEKYEQCLRLYKDIICGYSITIDSDGKEVYLKHLKDVDYSFFEQKRRFFQMEAERMGLPSESDVLELLDNTGNWSKEEENKYQNDKKELENLHKTHSKIFLESQRKIIVQKIKEKEEKFKDTSRKREELHIKTSEKFSQDKLNDYMLSSSIYRDPDLKEKLFKYDEYRGLDIDAMSIYSTLYYAGLAWFTSENLKRIGHLGLFLNSYMLSKGNPYFFFGKRICDLTSYQSIIASHANSCKNILENTENRLPDYDDIDDICEWFNREAEIINNKYRTDKKSSAAPTEGSSSRKQKLEGIGIPGASKEEIHTLAQSEKATPVNFIEAAENLKKKLGKDELNATDLIKIHD